MKSWKLFKKKAPVDTNVSAQSLPPIPNKNPRKEILRKLKGSAGTKLGGAANISASSVPSEPPSPPTDSSAPTSPALKPLSSPELEINFPHELTQKLSDVLSKVKVREEKPRDFPKSMEPDPSKLRSMKRKSDGNLFKAKITTATVESAGFEIDSPICDQDSTDQTDKFPTTFLKLGMSGSEGQLSQSSGQGMKGVQNSKSSSKVSLAPSLENIKLSSSLENLKPSPDFGKDKKSRMGSMASTVVSRRAPRTRDTSAQNNDDTFGDSRALGKAGNRRSLGISMSDLKETADLLKEAFKKLVIHEKIIKVSEPGGSESGPWTDSVRTSLVPQWNLDPATMFNKTAVHIMTVGLPFLNPESGEELRRIRIFEHHIFVPNMAEIAEKFQTDPAGALIFVDPILRNPNSKYKLTDKLLSQSAAVASLSAAQINLQPLFGTWLNPLLCSESDVKASSTGAYLCDYYPEQGTFARALKPLENNADREIVVEHLSKEASAVLESYWESSSTIGWSMCMVVPPGVKNGTYFH